MTLRLQRRIGIAPGVRMNLSKSGASVSLGVRGAHVTIGKTPRITLGIPGSGLSWTETMERGHRASPSAQGAAQPVQPRSGWQVALVVIGLLALLAIIASGGH